MITNERLPLGISQRAKGGETGNARSTTRAFALGIVLDFTHERSNRNYLTYLYSQLYIYIMFHVFDQGLTRLTLQSTKSSTFRVTM